MNRLEWDLEEAYLKNCYDSKEIPGNFNSSYDCFLSYVKMQSNRAFRDGFPKVCFSIRKGFNIWAGKTVFNDTECGEPIGTKVGE